MQVGQLDVVDLPPPVAPAARYRAPLAAALAARSAALGAALDGVQARPDVLAGIAAALVEALRAGGRVLVAGNGGSAAEAQHLATELVGRFKRERDPLPVVALSADGAVLTALANDYGYAEVFARQVRAFGRPGDVLVAFSTSGESENVVRAALAARERGMTVVAATAAAPSRLARLADLALRVPVADTPLAQEIHVVLLHLLCDVVEAELAATGPNADG
jgi:D-sedoheptulose 7-phosphate isomerase